MKCVVIGAIQKQTYVLDIKGFKACVGAVVRLVWRSCGVRFGVCKANCEAVSLLASCKVQTSWAGRARRRMGRKA